jgi:hypothetical protein
MTVDAKVISDICTKETSFIHFVKFCSEAWRIEGSPCGPEGRPTTHRCPHRPVGSVPLGKAQRGEIPWMVDIDEISACPLLLRLRPG